MDGLWIWLRGRSGAVGHIDADTQRPHDIHPNQDRGRFEADDYYEAGPSSSFTPLEAKVLGLPRDLEWFGVGTMDDTLESFKGPHWARYCHHTENPMQVTEAPVSTRPRTGMPSRLSWPVMDGPTTHPTGVTLASGDRSNSLTVRWGEVGSCPRVVAAPVSVLEGSAGAGACLLAKQALENWKGWAVGDEVSFQHSAGTAVEWRIFTVLLVEVASGRRRLSGCDSRSGNSGQGVGRGCCGLMGSDLFVGPLEILFKDPDLVLHCANQALHLGVGLLLEDFLDPSGGCDDFLHGPMSQFLDFSGEGPIQCS